MCQSHALFLSPALHMCTHHGCREGVRLQTCDGQGHSSLLVRVGPKARTVSGTHRQPLFLQTRYVLTSVKLCTKENNLDLSINLCHIVEPSALFLIATFLEKAFCIPGQVCY